jgi:hypothetical protein
MLGIARAEMKVDGRAEPPWNEANQERVILSWLVVVVLTNLKNDGVRQYGKDDIPDIMENNKCLLSRVAGWGGCWDYY